MCYSDQKQLAHAKDMLQWFLPLPSPHPNAHCPMISRNAIFWICINGTSIHPPLCIAQHLRRSTSPFLSIAASTYLSIFLFAPPYLGIRPQMECPLLLFLTSCHSNFMEHETGKWTNVHLLNEDNKPTLHKSNQLTKNPLLCWKCPFICDISFTIKTRPLRKPLFQVIKRSSEQKCITNLVFHEVCNHHHETNTTSVKLNRQRSIIVDQLTRMLNAGEHHKCL